MNRTGVNRALPILLPILLLAASAPAQTVDPPIAALLAKVLLAGQAGTLVLMRSNPSGLPEHDDERRLSLRLLPPD